ncbi:MAG TPA: type I-B CRISPR-associated protein Cas5 [Clostridium sp.]|nr:type I-B CRISPR-associated protein Cas5 [Clostridium sp.]
MKILKFTLKGKTGFFKKPDVNTYLYFTYGNIHRVALLGMFGAVLGLSGYNAMKLKESLKNKDKKNKIENKSEYPEFYEKLKDLKVAVTPNAERGCISKKVQVFNNSVGYASKEQGGNLIVKEQWLENPSWDIYVAIEDEISEKLAEYILSNKAVYQPYLGKNDHYADIMNAQLIDAAEADDVNRIHCLFKKDDFNIIFEDEEDEDDEVMDDLFKYEERLPAALNRDTNMYESCTFVFTNMKVRSKGGCTIYKADDKNIVFS